MNPFSTQFINNTKFINCLYQGDSGSGIIFENLKKNPEFSVEFHGCTIYNDVKYVICANGGFYFQKTGNQNLIIDNCSFSNCDCNNKGGVFYITNAAKITNCKFNLCRGNEGSILYSTYNSTKCEIRSSEINYIPIGKSLITINRFNDDKEFIFYNLTLNNNQQQEQGVIGINIRSTNVIIFQNCIVMNYSHDYNNSIIISLDSFIVLDSCLFKDNIGNYKQLIYSFDNVKINNCTFNNNKKIISAKTNQIFVYENNNITNIHIEGELFDFEAINITIRNCHFDSISCNYNGGLGLKISNDCKTLKFENCEFTKVTFPNLTKNDDSKRGGIFAVPLFIQKFYVEDCKCFRCGVGYRGGCFSIYNYFVSVDLANIEAYFINTRFTQCYTNHSNGYGGSIIFDDWGVSGKVHIIGCIFEEPPNLNNFNIMQINSQKIEFRNNTFQNIRGTYLIIGTRNTPMSLMFDTCTFRNIEGTTSDEYAQFLNNRVNYMNFQSCIFDNLSTLEKNGISLDFLLDITTTVVFNNTKFLSMKSQSAAGIFAYSKTDDRFTNAPTFYITNCFIGNIKSSSGLSAFISKGSIMNFINSTFMNCEAKLGAAILLSNDRILFSAIFNCTFINNYAEYGGAFYIEGSSSSILDVTGINNKAKYGGSFFVQTSPEYIIDLSTIFIEHNESNIGQIAFYGDSMTTYFLLSPNDIYITFSTLSSVQVTVRGSFSVEKAGEVKIMDSKMRNFYCDCTDIYITAVDLTNGSVSINSTLYVQATNVFLTRLTDLKMNSPSISFHNCTFNRNQLVINSKTDLIFTSCCFYSKDTSAIKLFAESSVNIDSYCCFNQKNNDVFETRSEVNYIIESQSVFSCFCGITDDSSADLVQPVAQVTKKVDALGIVLVVVSIFFLVTLIALYLKITDRKVEISSDEIDLDFAIPEIKCEIENTNPICTAVDNTLINMTFCDFDEHLFH